MTDYNEQNYIDACRALYRGGLTEICDTGKWRNWPAGVPSPQRAAQLQWRAVDPLREYKEAFAAGKRVEWKSMEGQTWHIVYENFHWETFGYEYRIVEPKKVKLLPFAYNDNGYWLTAGFFESIEKAKEEYRAGALIAPINPDGSIEVDA